MWAFTTQLHFGLKIQLRFMSLINQSISRKLMRSSKHVLGMCQKVIDGMIEKQDEMILHVEIVQDLSF